MRLPAVCSGVVSASPARGILARSSATRLARSQPTRRCALILFKTRSARDRQALRRRDARPMGWRSAFPSVSAPEKPAQGRAAPSAAACHRLLQPLTWPQGVDSTSDSSRHPAAGLQRGDGAGQGIVKAGQAFIGELLGRGRRVVDRVPQLAGRGDDVGIPTRAKSADILVSCSMSVVDPAK